jgi:phosphoribosylanthranilate isomerase
MALKTTVKVTINNLSDARYCAGMGVEFIGFSTDPDDPFYLSPDNFSEISEWLSGVDFVAETNGISETSDSYDVDYVQVVNPAEAILFSDKKIILEGTADDLHRWKDQLPEIKNLAFLLLVITGNTDTDDIIKEFHEYPLLIGYDISLDEVMALADSPATGIALKGSDEIKPGLKDYDELADILEALEVDEPY